MSSDPNLDELREESRPGQRADGTDNGTTLKEEFIASLRRAENGEDSITMSARGEQLAAFIHGLEEDEDGLEDVVERLHMELDKDGKITRSELIQCAFWVGIREVTPEILDEFQDAQAERARQF